MRSGKTELDTYLSNLNSTSSEVQAIERELMADDKWGINIGLSEALILQWMIHSHDVSSVVEIGTQYGYAAQWILEALPADGLFYSVEKDSENYEKAQSLLASDPRAQLIHGDALEKLTEIESEGPFDMVFIDANKKSYPQYSLWAQENVPVGGLIVADNTLLFGTVLSKENPGGRTTGMWKAMREFNQQLFLNKNFKTCLMPTPEGLTVSVRIK